MGSTHQPKDEEGKPIWHSEFIEYLADPQDKRTYAEFAESVGVAYITLWRYRQKWLDRINREVEAARRQYVSNLRSRAYKSLAQKLEHDTNALKLFFQLSGDLVERVENKVDMMTRDEKESKAREILEQLSKRMKENDGQSAS